MTAGLHRRAARALSTRAHPRATSGVEIRVLEIRVLEIRVLGLRVLGLRVLGLRVLGLRVLESRVLESRGATARFADSAKHTLRSGSAPSADGPLDELALRLMNRA
jgi:hypothetical protein